MAKDTGPTCDHYRQLGSIIPIIHISLSKLAQLYSAVCLNAFVLLFHGVQVVQCPLVTFTCWCTPTPTDTVKTLPELVAPLECVPWVAGVGGHGASGGASVDHPAIVRGGKPPTVKCC